jgi:hypothetical protein
MRRGIRKRNWTGAVRLVKIESVRYVVVVAVVAGLAGTPISGWQAGAQDRGVSIPLETSAAFDRYLAATDERVQSELGDSRRFLWADFASQVRAREVLTALRSGEVVLEKLTTTDHGVAIPVPGGLIHHWVGVVFVPNVHVREAVALMQDYDRHDEVFAPSIARSRVISRGNDTFQFSMRFVIKKVITAVLQTDQSSRFFSPAPDRTHSRIVSTRIVEIENAGTPSEREKPPERDRGYLWRQASYWRFLERDGGTYVQCESMSLSRPLPTAIGWLFGRSAASVPPDTLRFTLGAARRELVRR